MNGLISLRANLPKFYLLALMLALELINSSVIARPTKSIIFTHSSQSVMIQRGCTKTLTNYISTSDNAPVSVILTAIDSGGNIPSWLSVDSNTLDAIRYTSGSEISFGLDASKLSAGKYSCVV